METKINDVDLIGQRLLKSGFKRVTKDDIHSILKCNEIRDMENKLIKDEFKAELDKLTSGWSKRKKEKVKIETLN